MGQQQLLLIVLGVIIVGIAIAVGVTQFKSGAVESNRQSMISDILNYAAKAQRFYRTPTALAGGSQDFQNFSLAAVDTGNANGSYSITTTQPSGTGFVAGSIASISAAAQTIYIVGCGVEQNGGAYVKAYATVTADDITTTVLN